MFAFFAAPAHACDKVDVEAPGVSVHVDDCADEAPPAVLRPPTPPEPPEVPDDEDEDEDEDAEHHDPFDRRQVLLGQYGLQFLPNTPAHQGSLRLVGEGDAYVGGELRYMPGQDFVGVGRVGAGLDLFGGGDFDLTFGLWVGGAGEWERDLDAARLWGSPVLGTEVGLGWEGRRLFAKYRWLGGVGGGALSDLLTENELVFGYKVTRNVHVMGQYVLLDPGDARSASGVGLGMRLAL